LNTTLRPKPVESQSGCKGYLDLKSIYLISQEFDINEKGPKIYDSVAKVVNKSLKGKMDITILREK
jgi:hypothetical protein